MTFRIGQKIICVRRFKDRFFGETMPEVGQTYTVRGFDKPTRDGDFVFLEEIVNPPVNYIDGYGECSWWVTNFRPVVLRKIDIGIFTSLLNQNPTTKETTSA